jgi:hypothetical protein
MAEHVHLQGLIGHFIYVILDRQALNGNVESGHPELFISVYCSKDSQQIKKFMTWPQTFSCEIGL